MEFATGALGTLLPKLGELLLDEYNLQKGLKKGIKDLRDELLVIQAALVRVSDVPLDQLDPQVKIWANDVRELSFAIEDSLDSFMVRVEGLEPTKPHTFFGFINKACKKVTKLKIRREIANDIKDVKIQVKEVKERYDRYKDVVGNTYARTEVDPRLLAMYSKVSDLVGIEKSMDELTERLLSEGDNPSGEKLKVVSVVGFGGLGKTTLAKAVYDKLKKNFDCGAFVPVGQSPDTKKVLRDILHELDKQKYKDITSSKMDVKQLIDEVRGFLVDKRFGTLLVLVGSTILDRSLSNSSLMPSDEIRYFIVTDDIWDITTWEMIKCALVDSNYGSRIITTTRNAEVAKKVGGIYNMKPLSDVDSKCLFYTRTCGGEGVCPDNQPAEVTNKILKKCGGVPLAIITIASLLVGKQSDDWSKVYDAIGFGTEDNATVHNTRKILSFSYYDLPASMKTCLLYLSMFPEDSFIEKKILIWRWVSEGFVPDRSFELGEIYFNELVNKSMILWIEPDALDKTEGGCRVHDMVLDLIRTISEDVNFVTVHDMEQPGTCSRTERTNRVRRLAVHGRSVEHNSSNEMEHVRSFYAISCSGSWIAQLSIFKVLRVLDIENCVFPEGRSLEHLGKLVHLRYLGLWKTDAKKLPEGIGHDLKLLEILDVRGGLISELPPSVGELMNLRCLWADEGTVMKGEIGKLTCLEELELSSVEKCPNFFKDVGKLTKLRVLKIILGEIEESAVKALMESLCNLHKIHSLRVLDDDGEREYSVVLNHSLEDLAPCTKLYELVLPIIVIPRVPSWINHLSAPLLSWLCLHVEAVEVRDVQTIGRLPSLLVLFLWSKDEESISYTFGSNEFHKLTILYTKKIEIAFGEGALPMLELLAYSASAERKDAASLVPWRSNSCPLLKEVTCFLDCTNSSYKEVKEAKQALKQASGTRPNFYLSIEKQNYDKEAGKFIDNLEWILRGLDRPEDVGRPAHQEERMRRMIRSLERRLREAGEPRVGRYCQQELRGLVTKFKSWLHDHEAGKSGVTDREDDDDEDYYYDDDDATDQAEVDDAETTCSGDQQEEGGSQP